MGKNSGSGGLHAANCLRPRRCEREANEYAALLWMAAVRKKEKEKRNLTGSFQIETRVKSTEGGGGGVEP